MERTRCSERGLPGWMAGYMTNLFSEGTMGWGVELCAVSGTAFNELCDRDILVFSLKKIFS